MGAVPGMPVTRVRKGEEGSAGRRRVHRAPPLSTPPRQPTAPAKEDVEVTKGRRVGVTSVPEAEVFIHIPYMIPYTSLCCNLCSSSPSLTEFQQSCHPSALK